MASNVIRFFVKCTHYAPSVALLERKPAFYGVRLNTKGGLTTGTTLIRGSSVHGVVAKWALLEALVSLGVHVRNDRIVQGREPLRRLHEYCSRQSSRRLNVHYCNIKD